MPFGHAAASFSPKSAVLWSMAASKRNSSLMYRHFSAPPAMPTARAPAILASCPTSAPTGPLAAATTTVSPAFGLPITYSPEIGGEARHAEHTQAGGDRRLLRIEFAQRRAAPGRVRAPAGVRENDI